MLGDSPLKQPPTAGMSVDGFVRGPMRPAPAPSARAYHDAPLHGAPVKAIDAMRDNPHHVQHHKPQHATTLMRQSVNKPAAGLKRTVKVVAPVHHALTTMQHFDIMPKEYAGTLDEHRLKRASGILHSNLVSRFGSMQVQNRQAQPLHRPVATVQPRPTQHQLQAAHPAAHPIQAGIARSGSSTDIFERAMAAANSHQQPSVNRKHSTKRHTTFKRIGSIAASTLAILLIVGFVAYMNATSLQMRLASSRAGISASLPTWQPEGFTIGKFSYAPGTVTLSFRGNDPDQHFTLMQTASNWDSAALLSDYVLPNNDTYNAIQSGGTTIYTYGDNNATWVSSNIWYKLTTNGSLTTSEIVHIATSM